MKIAAASVISGAAPEPPILNRIRKTRAFLRKLSLNAEKNWHQNRGAKRRDNRRGLGSAGVMSVMQSSLCQERALITTAALWRPNITLIRLPKIRGGGEHEHGYCGAAGRRRQCRRADRATAHLMVARQNTDHRRRRHILRRVRRHRDRDRTARAVSAVEAHPAGRRPP